MSLGRWTRVSLLWGAVALCAACDDSASGPVGGADPSSAAPEEVDAGRDSGAPAPSRDASSAAADADVDEDAGIEAPSCGSGECDLLDPLACDDVSGCLLLIEENTHEARTQCVEVGAGRDGDACDSYLDCGPGLDCTQTGGSCRRPCCALNQAAGCPRGQFCRIGLTDGDGESTGVALCDRCDDCDPSDASACGDGLGCYALRGGGACAACLFAGEAAVGEACARANDCAPGAGCFAVGDEGSRCVAFCVRDDVAACDAGQACRAVSGIELPDGIGLCL